MTEEMLMKRLAKLEEMRSRIRHQMKQASYKKAGALRKETISTDRKVGRYLREHNEPLYTKLAKIT